MTSVYDEKIYPELPSAPPEESQAYRLQKISEAEKFLQSEIQTREKLTKKQKQRSNALTISDTSIITVITILEAASIATLTTGVGVPISIFLASTGLLLGLGSAAIHKSQKIFDSKAKKHDKIKTLAESKLDTISGIVSKAIEDTYISNQEYHLILEEIKHYRTMKEEIRSKSKRVVKEITKEQREAILAQGREEGKQAFLAKIAASSDIPCRISLRPTMRSRTAIGHSMQQSGPWPCSRPSGSIIRWPGCAITPAPPSITFKASSC